MCVLPHRAACPDDEHALSCCAVQERCKAGHLSLMRQMAQSNLLLWPATACRTLLACSASEWHPGIPHVQHASCRADWSGLCAQSHRECMALADHRLKPTELPHTSTYCRPGREQQEAGPPPHTYPVHVLCDLAVFRRFSPPAASLAQSSGKG